MDYAIQTRFSDPGVHAGLFDALPDDVSEIAAVVRNLLIHYRAGGIEFTGERLAEIDNRWVSAILATDQKRNGTALAVPREPVDRVVGCCRDYTLLFVSMLRHKGIPARSRVGFGNYFTEGFSHDHVVAEYWNGDRWVMIDAEMDPADPRFTFDVADMPAGPFLSAAEVWRGYRSGELNGDLFGADPNPDAPLKLHGGWFIRTYVHYQLAHLNGDELLLWDNWGSMSDTLEGADVELTDRIADLMVASDNGDDAATKEVNELYRTDPGLTYAGRAFVTSPAGSPFAWKDLG
ncbi:transglutaminase family protein [Kribbella sp. VKM Ac-2566]|uniref:transglutaminase-like domain-containing protein n=1 Tax=Kribbella sp. VKM Ac-2566 TaxID=2512218 RepID=UPI00106450BD|nr:transglutaminase-like domain-containing protein [Kribbella sp. VKM Ac-2566]TDW83488.1 transglutaminase superfamily protein [Kribbella sp. VKM Ac-2566]